jgi:hypothetical protein
MEPASTPIFNNDLRHVWAAVAHDARVEQGLRANALDFCSAAAIPRVTVSVTIVSRLPFQSQTNIDRVARRDQFRINRMEISDRAY